jgi:hypothetical protein
MNAPVESKVKAAGWAALVAAFVVSYVITLVPGLSTVAEPIQAAIVAVLTSGAAYVAGWLAKHTARPAEPTSGYQRNSL